MNLDQVIAIKGSLDDLLFRGKNKSYGAYDLRKSYPQHLKKSLVIFLFLVLGIVAAYVLYDKLKDKVIFKSEAPIRKVTELKAPPPLDETTPPPPPPPPPPPVKATIQFVPPKIVEVAPPDEEIKTVDEIKESKAEISTATVVGQDIDDLDAGTDAGVGVEAPRSEEPLVFAEQMPEFPGGDDALMAYLQRNIKYPAFALENEIEGVVMVNFVVNSDGSISKVNVTKGIKGGCDEEASRVVRNMPKWKPGKQGGQPVPVYFDVPVNFKIE
jgi:protein TonB